MKVALHVAISGQMAMQNRLDSIAANVANMTTPGYRAEGSKFDALVSRQQPGPVDFASTGRAYIVRRPGALKATGNPLDVALNGDVWMALQGPDGIVYTRDGRMRMTPEGALVSVRGYPVLDVSGSPLMLKPKGGPPRIARDGMIRQRGRRIGAIGLFRFGREARLTRFDNSAVIPDREAEPVVEFSRAGVVQGFIEESNVNGALEMSRLIEATSAFRQLSAALSDGERTALEAIRTLGGAGN